MQARSNAAALHELYEAFGRRDLDAFLDGCTDDVALESDLGAYPAGHAGVRRWWADMLDAFAVGAPKPILLVELGDVVIALATTTWRGRASGVEFLAERVQVTRWRHGRVCRWTFSPSLEAALAAAELDPAQAAAWKRTQLVVQAIEAFSRRDFAPVLALVHDDVVARSVLRERVEGDSPYHGRAGVQAWVEDMLATFERFEIHPREVRWSEDRGVLVAEIATRGSMSQAALDQRVAYIMDWRGERMAAIQSALDVDAALALVSP